MSTWPVNSAEFFAASVAYNHQAGLIEQALQQAHPLVAWQIERHDLMHSGATVRPDAFRVRWRVRVNQESLDGWAKVSSSVATADVVARARSLVGPAIWQAILAWKPAQGAG